MAPITINRRQAREVDHRAIRDYGIPGLVLMENAGRGVTDVLVGLGIAGPVLVCCGRGNNAGDGFVVARHLEIRGYQPQVLVWGDPAELTGDAAANYAILAKTDVPIEVFRAGHDPARLAGRLADAAWVVDGLLGTGAKGAPRPPLDEVIEQLNRSPAARLAIDLPSGLDCDTGEVVGVAFRADHTCSFLAVKAGFLAAGASGYTGQVHVLDIGAPRKLLAEVLRES